MPACGVDLAGSECAREWPLRPGKQPYPRGPGLGAWQSWAEGGRGGPLQGPERPAVPGPVQSGDRGPVRAPPPAGHTGGWRTSWRGASGLGRCHLRSPLLSDCVSGSHSVAGPWLSQVYLE